MNCPCCNKTMRYEQYYKIHVCDCQGKLLEYDELITRANQAQSVAAPSAGSNQVNPHIMAPQGMGKAQIDHLPTSEYYTVTIPSDCKDKTFLAKHNYYLDFRNKVWFKKIKATDYLSEKSTLDRASIIHQVLGT